MRQSFLLPDFEESAEKPVNVASVPQRSPFRYPGGKTWFVPTFREWVASLPSKPSVLVEPFAGGATISLAAVAENMTEKAVMVELDSEVAAVWKTILDGEGDWLARQIIEFDLTLENAVAELERKPRNTREIAFQTMLKNRTFHGGILAEGAGFLKNGEAGKGIRSRWYPQTLAKRIRNIGLIAHRLELIQGDAFRVLRKMAHREDVIFFIDPPYTAGGKSAGSRLYTHFELDHEKLFTECEHLRGPFLMTYDNAEEVKALSRKHGFEMKTVAMKNTHHAEMTELLIGRDLSFLEKQSVLQETPLPYGSRRKKTRAK